MTDKVQKIREEVEKCYNECLKRTKITDSDYWNAKADAYRNVLVILNDYLEEEVKYIRKDAIMALIVAEKEETGIGLCEYDVGHENGRMEVIMSLTEKIKAL